MRSHQPPQFKQPTENSSIPLGNGLTAEYFDNSDFTASSLKRLEATINFQWGNS